MGDAIRCETFTFDGVTYWHEAGAPHRLILARREGDVVEDLRRSPVRAGVPLFAQLLPCPYCGVKEDRGHYSMKHVNPRLGTVVDSALVEREVVT